MAAFTGNGYLVADTTELLAIPAVDRPAFKVALLVSGSGWYEYDNTATTGGLTPTDNPATGRWFPIGSSTVSTWSTINRPVNPPLGTQGYNTTLSRMEYFANGAWIAGLFGFNAGLSYMPAITGTIAAGANTASIVYYNGEDNFVGYGYRYYISKPDTDEVLVINALTNTVVTNITVGDNPRGIAFEEYQPLTEAGLYIWVCNRDSNNVSRIDPFNNTVNSTLTVGTQPVSVVYCSSNTKIYVANSGSNGLTVIETFSGVVESTISLGRTQREVHYCAANDSIYIFFNSGVRISVLNPSTNTIVTTIDIGDQPIYGFAYCPSNNKIYVGKSTFGTVLVINATTNIIEAEINTTLLTGTISSLVYSAYNNRIYVSQGGSVAIIDPFSNSVISVVNISATTGQNGLFAQTLTNRVYCTSTGTSNLTLVS